MAWRFKADGNIGKAALYTVPTVDSTDDAPLTAPRAHLSRVRFHTDFKYPSVVSDQTFNVTLPSRSVGSRGEATHTLGAHGRGGVPLCFGSIQYGGHWVPLFISTPLNAQPFSVGMRNEVGRVISLGANSTNILLHEYWALRNLAGSLGAYAAEISVRVLVTTELL